jgi:DNA-binding CsgD family transcriptional regulator
MVCYATNWHIVDLTLKKTSAFQFYPQEYKPLKSTTLYTARLSDDKMVITLGAQLWEFDIKHKAFLAEYVNKERRPFIENGYYTNLFSENDKTFWLASNINGLIEAVRLGGSPMSSVIARKTLQLLANSHQNNLPKEDTDLSDREMEILELTVEGLDYKQTAQKLYVSHHTVRAHIYNIYKKLHVTSKAQAVKLALKKNWF